MSDEFTVKLIATYNRFKLLIDDIGSSDYILELNGTKSQINTYLNQLKFVASDDGINYAKTLEALEEVNIIEIIQVKCSAIRNNKRYYKTGTITIRLDSFKHSKFIISGKNEAFVQQINNLTWSQFEYITPTSGSYLSGYVYIDDSIIDAEKHPPRANDNLSDWTTMDDDLCWAGSCSNMLEFSGWGRNELGLTIGQKNREDSFFRYFIDRTQVDNGFEQFPGLIWFGTGENLDLWSGHAWVPKSNMGNALNGINLAKTSDKKLRWYSGDEPEILSKADPSKKTLAEYFNTHLTQLSMYQLLELFLRNGYAVGYNIVWIVNDELDSSGHAVTCVGISYNTNYSYNDVNYYTGVFIVDSDNTSDISVNKDVINYCPLTYNSTWNVYFVDIYHGIYPSSYKIYCDEIIPLGRNNGYYDHFFNYGQLIDTTTSKQLREPAYYSKSDFNKTFTYDNIKSVTSVSGSDDIIMPHPIGDI